MKDANPFAELPTAPVDLAEDPPLASPMSRVGARVVDGAFLMAPMVALLMALEAVTGELSPSATDNPLYFVPSLTWMLAFYAWCAYGISKRGQTPGKRLLGIRVDKQGSPPGFVTGVLAREVLFLMVSSFVGSLVTCGMAPLLPGFLVNVVFLFREGHRTLHDRLAGTRVVRAS